MFHSQDSQDFYLETNIFKGYKNGFFVDVGAHDGITINNTLYFEKNNNWNGINIEPIKKVYDKLVINRPNNINLNCAVCNSDGETDFLCNTGYTEMISGIKDTFDNRHLNRLKNENSQMGSVTEVIKVNTKNLETIFDENNISHINYLSIDVEGAEFEVIKSINFDKVFIDVIGFENNYDDNSIPILEYLQNKNFEFCHKSTDIFMINKTSKFYKMNQISYNLMNNNDKYLNNCNDEIVLITAFFDISRDKWLHLQRDSNYYLDSFKNLLLTEKNIIAFIDEKYFNIDFIQNYIYNANLLNRRKTKIIPINIDWLNSNCESWKKFEIAKKIMKSNEYIEKVKSRIKGCSPENTYPEYNTINHSKIDFIKYAIDNNLIDNNDFICWCDFGYYKSILHNNSFEYPYSCLDIKKFSLNKLNFCLRNKIIINDADINYTLINARETFTGSFFSGKPKLMNKLYYLYHECLDELYENNVSDDDQHVYLRCFLKEPNIFELFLSENKWPEALTYFQKNFNNRYDFINSYINDINFGKFVEIGVCSGALSENILNNNKKCFLYCVDPYLNYVDYDDACKYEVGDSLYYSTKDRLNNLFPNRTMFIRKFSKTASEDIIDKLDFVYIDSNHKFQYVLEDLNIWYDKLKPGGIIICDDAVDTNEELRDINGDVFIQWNSNSFGKYGVVKACNVFVNNKNTSFFKWNNQIVIHKPLFLNKLENKKKIVAFLSNKLTLRGTEIAIYDYADYNEKILGNKSIIITRDYEKIKNEWDVDIQAYNKFRSRFDVFYYSSQQDIDGIVLTNNVSHIFIEKAGDWDGLASNACKNIIHCVFSTSQPHGQVYTPIGQTINNLQGTNYPVMPYMVTLPESNENLRLDLNIPKEAIVFGRYGGKESFDINFVYDVIKNIVNLRDDVYFLFMNTNVFYEHKNIIYLPGNANMVFKRKFINTCDALIHARDRGETFGLTCGEFAICKKPVITYGLSRENEHLLILKDKAVIYNNPQELENIFMTYTKDKYDVSENGYMFYNPKNVMEIFNKVCLI